MCVTSSLCRFQAPSLAPNVKISITGMNLRLGSIINQGDSMQASGFIYKQIPEEGQVVKVGEAIDLWVTPTDSLLNILLEEYNLNEEESGEGEGIDIL